jgi:hypothetical protein
MPDTPALTFLGACPVDDPSNLGDLGAAYAAIAAAVEATRASHGRTEAEP